MVLKNIPFFSQTTLLHVAVQKNNLMAAWPLKEAAAEINFIQKNKKRDPESIEWAMELIK